MRKLKKIKISPQKAGDETKQLKTTKVTTAV